MLDSLKKLLGLQSNADYAEIIEKGAVIVDVRSHGEYSSGHIKGSVNIPLDTLKGNMSKLNKETPIITCCASGMRSASAMSILRSAGFQEVYNGGGWVGLNSKITEQNS